MDHHLKCSIVDIGWRMKELNTFNGLKITQFYCKTLNDKSSLMQSGEKMVSVKLLFWLKRPQFHLEHMDHWIELEMLPLAKEKKIDDSCFSLHFSWPFLPWLTYSYRMIYNVQIVQRNTVENRRNGYFLLVYQLREHSNIIMILWSRLETATELNIRSHESANIQIMCRK